MKEDYGDAINSFFEYCRKFPALAVYGAGDVGGMVAEFMEEEGIPFGGFCVSGKPERNMSGGREVKGFDEMEGVGTKTGIIVAVSRKNAEDILGMLDSRKVSFFYSTEFLFRLFERKCRKSVSRVLVQDGMLCKIDDIIFHRDTLYLCCPASIGDTLYAAAFVAAYKKQNPSVEKVCLILKKGHRELGKLFPAVDGMLVSDEIVETLDRYSIYMQVWKLKNYLYGHFKKSIHFVYDPKYGQEGCQAILPRYRRLIMGLPDTAEPEGMALCRDTAKPEDVVPRRVHEQTEKRDVVIMPYARTAEMLPLPFWEGLVRRLNGKGYSVYTNIGGGREKAIGGTKPIEKSLLETALFCEGCAAVISLRSGLCDLLGFTEAKLVVINTSRELSTEWNLKEVFIRDGIYNVDCFGNGDRQEKLCEIMEIINRPDKFSFGQQASIGLGSQGVGKTDEERNKMQGV